MVDQQKKNKTFVCNCKEDQVELKHYCQKDQQLFCSDSLLDHADHKQVIQRVGQTQIDEMIQQTLSILKKDIEERQKRLQQYEEIYKNNVISWDDLKKIVIDCPVFLLTQTCKQDQFDKNIFIKNLKLQNQIQQDKKPDQIQNNQNQQKVGVEMLDKSTQTDQAQLTDEEKQQNSNLKNKKNQKKPKVKPTQQTPESNEDEDNQEDQEQDQEEEEEEEEKEEKQQTKQSKKIKKGKQLCVTQIKKSIYGKYFDGEQISQSLNFIRGETDKYKYEILFKHDLKKETHKYFEEYGERINLIYIQVGTESVYCYITSNFKPGQQSGNGYLITNTKTGMKKFEQNIYQYIKNECICQNYAIFVNSTGRITQKCHQQTRSHTLEWCACENSDKVCITMNFLCDETIKLVKGNRKPAGQAIFSDHNPNDIIPFDVFLGLKVDPVIDD